MFCPNCGVDLNSKNSRKVFCSQSCQIIAWKKRNPTKQKNYPYRRKKYLREYMLNKWNNDPVFREKHQIRKFHGNLRKKYLKDKCEHCGSVEKLQIHHIDYKKEIDLSSISTLCFKCHKLEHKRLKTYVKKANFNQTINL